MTLEHICYMDNNYCFYELQFFYHIICCVFNMLSILLTFLDIWILIRNFIFWLNIIRFWDFKLSVWLNDWSNLNEIYTVDEGGYMEYIYRFWNKSINLSCNMSTKLLISWEITVQCSSMVLWDLIKFGFIMKRFDLCGEWVTLSWHLGYYLWFLTLNIYVIFHMGARSFIHRSNTLTTNIYSYQKSCNYI